jgi:DNA-binding FrmR family transcriptional regulator
MNDTKEKKQELLNHLKRISGQLESLQKKIENDEYSIEIITQTKAISNSFESVRVKSLEYLILEEILKDVQLSQNNLNKLEKLIDLQKR